MKTIIIATIKKWNIKNFSKLQKKYFGKYNLFLITTKEELTYSNISHLNPKYIFFPHWSWKIPEEIHKNFRSIVFHMTDLPFGRGGSPLQNLISQQIYETKVSAIKVTQELDEGNIYIKKPFSLALGSAEEIFIKLSRLIFEEMIPQILENDITPTKQTGKVTIFKRRVSSQSDITLIENKNLTNLYDFIRMLDAEGYPKAYIKYKNIKVEFSEVHMKNNKLIGKFEVFENE